MTDIKHLSERQLDRAIAGRLDTLLGPGYGDVFLTDLRATRAAARDLSTDIRPALAAPLWTGDARRGPEGG